MDSYDNAIQLLTETCALESEVVRPAFVFSILHQG